jgi:hypothetical protein
VADTIRVGRHFITGEKRYPRLSMEKKNFARFSLDTKTDMPNLLGNGFLANFDVVFDFQNFYLYLKPIED